MPSSSPPPLHPQFPSPSSDLPPLQTATQRARSLWDHWLHRESTGGIVLLVAAALALLWANSPWAASYHALWHTPWQLSIGSWSVKTDLHFLINDGLMTAFFLVVGMEIRREMHSGALANRRQAMLPVIAALGGVVVPALIYLALVGDTPGLRQGWAIPTATDIAFAVGVLALLGPSIPGPLRIFLLALAIIDDIAAILIIAFFYSDGLNMMGLLIAAAGLLGVRLFNRMGVVSAWWYVLPGLILWVGLLYTGAHPTLAGVVLGLMTPVALRPALRHPLHHAHSAMAQLRDQAQQGDADPSTLYALTRQLHLAQRDLLAPVFRLPMVLHPWVAMGVMPLFALANAGVPLVDMELSRPELQTLMLAIAAALLLGKPLGVCLATFLAVRTGLCSLPAGVSWSGVLLVGWLAGIGFTMAIFVSGLAFADASLLNAAKAGILIASALAAAIGLGYGMWARKQFAPPSSSV